MPCQDYKGELKKDAIKKWVTKPLKSFVHKVTTQSNTEPRRRRTWLELRAMCWR